MLILRQFISRFRDFLLLFFYILLSSAMMLSSDSAIVEGLRSSSLMSIGFIQGTLSEIDSYFALRKTNRELVLENTKLAYKNYQMQDALLENLRLHKLLEFTDHSEYQFIPAKIIGYSPIDFVTGYLVKFNQADSVKKNSAVITPDGLVGKIIKVSSHYAICQNLLDANSRVSVRVQRSRELGILAWDGTNGLLLKNISNTIDIQKGDVLFTSGMSQIYPPNIKAGIVTSVHKNEESLFQTIYVKPVVNFNNLEELVIIQPGKKNEI